MGAHSWLGERVRFGKSRRENLRASTQGNHSKLKILFVIDSLGTGGAERTLAEKLPQLRRLGLDTVVVGLRHREQGVQSDLQQQGFDVRILSARGFAGRVAGLRRIIRDERPDLIQTVLFHADLTGRLAALGSTARVISRLCNTDYDKIRRRDPRHRAVRFRIAQFLDGWTARHLTDHLCANSHAVKAAAIRDLRVAPESVTVILEGRDSARLSQPTAERKAAVRARLGLEKDDEVLINVGRQDFQKGQSYLLEAVGKLLKKHPRLVLLVAGRSGDVSNDLDLLHARLGLTDHVRFLGHREDVPDLLAAADVFVFPSFYEGLPGAVMEAMALALPIVASDIEPVREIVQEGRNAILVRTASAEDLASAIERILEDRLMTQEFGRRSREIFEEQFTLEQNILQMVEFYRRIVPGSIGARESSS
jgi:glycosyltransferase involved in cell wall biosynthesis